MPYLNRDGRFKARIIEHSLTISGPNKLITFIGKYETDEVWVDGKGWEPCAHEHITGYHYLDKKDGAINQHTYDALCDSLGWDGRDPGWLNDTDLTNVGVQITCEFEDYNGKPSLKVKWLNAYDSEPGIKKSDSATLDLIRNRIGSQLRALAGGTPGPAPKVPDKKPSPAQPPQSPPAPSSPPQSAPQPAPPKFDARAAWSEFVKVNKTDNISGDQITAEWSRILKEMFGTDDPKKITAAQWEEFMRHGITQFMPF